MESVFKDTGGRGRSSLDRNSSGKREFGVAGSSKDCNKKLRIEEVSNQIDGRRSAETGLEQRRVLGRVERGKEQAQGRVCTRKDRHSKVNTSKGPRDRRVRLSVSTAIQFYDVQDRLGVDQPSKAVEWLIRKAKAAIDELEDLPAPAPPAEHMLQPLPHPDPVPVTSSLLACPPELHSACSYGSASPGLLKMCEERMQASRAKTKDRERAKARERAKEKLRSKEGGDSKLLLVNSEPFGLDWFHSHIIPDSSSCYHRAWPGSQACVDEEARPMSQQLYPHQPTISPSSFALDLQPTSSPPFPHQQFCASGWPPPVADVPLTAGPVEMDEDGDKQRQQRPVALQEQQAATEYWQTDDVANVVGGAASSHSHSLSMGPLQSIPAAYMPAVFPSTAMSVFPHHSQQHGPQRMCDYNPSGSSLFEQGRCSPRIEDVEAELKNTS